MEVIEGAGELGKISWLHPAGWPLFKTVSVCESHTAGYFQTHQEVSSRVGATKSGLLRWNMNVFWGLNLNRQKPKWILLFILWQFHEVSFLSCRIIMFTFLSVTQNILPSRQYASFHVDSTCWRADVHVGGQSGGWWARRLRSQRPLFKTAAWHLKVWSSWMFGRSSYTSVCPWLREWLSEIKSQDWSTQSSCVHVFITPFLTQLLHVGYSAEDEDDVC